MLSIFGQNIFVAMSDSESEVSGFGSETSNDTVCDGFGSETCSECEDANGPVTWQMIHNESPRRRLTSVRTVRTQYFATSVADDSFTTSLLTEFSEDTANESAVVTLENIPEGKRKRAHMPSWTGSKVRRESSKKRSFRLKDTEIEKVLDLPCRCGQDCALRLTAVDVQHERLKYWQEGSERLRTEYMVLKLGVDGLKHIETQKFEFRYLLNNTKVCGSFFEQALGVSHRKLTDVRGRVIEERFQTVRRTKKNNGGYRGRQAIEFIKSYAVQNGNVQPTIKDSTDPKAKDIHLPHGIRKEDVYISYRASISLSSVALHLSSFYEVWRNGLQQVVCRKHQKFAQCKVCSQLKFRQQRGTRDNRGKLYYF